MHLRRSWWSGVVAVMLVGLVGVTAVAEAQFLPLLVAREGALGLCRYRRPMATSTM